MSVKTGEFAVALSAARKRYPQMRIGQIISNALSVADGPGGDPDIFYVSDEKLVRAIERYAEQEATP